MARETPKTFVEASWLYANTHRGTNCQVFPTRYIYSLPIFSRRATISEAALCHVCKYFYRASHVPNNSIFYCLENSWQGSSKLSPTISSNVEFVVVSRKTNCRTSHLAQRYFLIYRLINNCSSLLPGVYLSADGILCQESLLLARG